MTLLRSPSGGDLPVSIVRRRVSDARARLVLNTILIAAITVAIASVLIALGTMGR